MDSIDDHGSRIAAALAGALAAETASSAPGNAVVLLGIAESLATVGSFDIDDLHRRELTGAAEPGPAALLVRVVAYGLATPLDRPRLRRDAYRYAAATGADEGTAIACVGAALVAADLLRFDAAMTAIRVRQSLLEDAPMALLNSITLLDRDATRDGGSDDPGAVLQLALSAVAWTDGDGVAAALAALGDDGRHVVGILAAAAAGARAGRCDVPIDDVLRERVDRVARGLAALAAGAAA